MLKLLCSFPVFLMSLLSKKPKPQCSAGCTVMKWVVALLLLLVTIAAGFGIYQTHIVPKGVQFGGTDGSLAILAFTISLIAWSRQMASCMRQGCEVCGSL